MLVPQKRCDHKYNKQPNCPICLKREVQFNMEKKLIKDSFFGSSPTPFVGRFNYPNINVGILSPQHEGEKNWLYDAPRFWSERNFTIPSLVNLRSELINARFKANVNDVRKEESYLDLSKQVGMASKPVDVEVNLNKAPMFTTNTSNFVAPTGPNAQLKKVLITSNPKIDRKVDKVNSDTDLKASEAFRYLYKNNFDENMLTKMLSVGSVGVKTDRKLVPTRWSITATDDILGKQLITEIKDYKYDNYKAYFGQHLGNYYLVLFFPEPWSYELFEMYASDKTNEWSKNNLSYATDYEPYKGRTSYVIETAGGYYAPRLAILEHLKKIKRQASVLVFRFITDDYHTPLGVWVTRESVRKSLSNNPLTFSSSGLMLKYAKILAKRKYNISLEPLLKKSKILSALKQVKLSGFGN